MENAFVYWTHAVERPVVLDANSDETGGDDEVVHSGLLTIDHESATDDTPVVVEDETGRVYGPDDLPAETTLFIEGSPGEFPEIAELAKRAGFHVARAATGDSL